MQAVDEARPDTHSVRARKQVDFRLYRLAWLPAVFALIVLMFSLEGAPEAVEPATATATFEGERAVAEARRIAVAAPEREPGGAGDAQVADLVESRFEEVAAGAVSEQTFETAYEGEQVELRNVLLTLPGEAQSSVVVAAARDSARGPGAASSAAATAVLIELANALGVTGHEKTYVLASTSGSAAGAAGARELLANLPERDSVDAVIVISQPGAAQTESPYVVSTATDESSGPAQLERTAELAVETQAELRSGAPSVFIQLARMAFPAGLGDQAPLIADGFDAISISAAGERLVEPSADLADDLSAPTLEAFGRAVQATVAAVDVAAADLDPGAASHLELGDNLLGGWTVALLALALLLPAAVAATDACARAWRSGSAPLAGLAWGAARALPWIGALVALYALAIVGAIPRPPFPFDPALYGFGARAAITLALIVVAGVTSAILLRSRGVSADRAPGAALPAIGAIAVASCLAIWLANPFLALLLVPAAHVWLLGAGGPNPLRAVAVLAASILACVPAVAALATVAAALDLGPAAPWTFALMVADAQIGLAVTVPLCFLGGALLGGSALAARRGWLGQAESPGPGMVGRPHGRVGAATRNSNER